MGIPCGLKTNRKIKLDPARNGKLTSGSIASQLDELIELADKVC
jgi:hypothetical protein